MHNKDVMPPTHQSSAWANGRPVPPPDRLSNFYRNTITSCSTLLLSRKRERLATENAQLEDLIQQFMDGTKLSETVLDSQNPLFVVNGRANLNHKPPVVLVKPTVQNANIINSTVQRQMI